MNVLKLLFIPFKRLGHQSSVLVPVGSGYPESITPQETARLTRRGHEILLRESQEETSAIKRWDDQLDERNRDPMSSPPTRLSLSQLPWEVRGGGVMMMMMHSFFRIGELRVAVQQDRSSRQPSIFLVCRSVHLLLQPFIRPFLWPKGHVSLWPW